MNKAFRAIWNDVRQSFVTTSEIQTSHGKSTKSSVSLCVAAALFVMGGVASAAYVETGVVGDKSSWETPEYQADWGLEAMIRVLGGEDALNLDGGGSSTLWSGELPDKGIANTPSGSAERKVANSLCVYE